MAKVLIAGEDTAAIDILAAEIAGLHHEAVTVSTGKDAYDSALLEQPDLIVLDEQLPIFSAHETCALLRSDPALPERLPIILFATEEPDTRSLERAGLDACLHKSHPLSEVADLMARCVTSPVRF